MKSLAVVSVAMQPRLDCVMVSLYLGYPPEVEVHAAMSGEVYVTRVVPTPGNTPSIRLFAKLVRPSILPVEIAQTHLSGLGIKIVPLHETTYTPIGKTHPSGLSPLW